jgi:hypothetical protein
MRVNEEVENEVYSFIPKIITLTTQSYWPTKLTHVRLDAGFEQM